MNETERAKMIEDNTNLVWHFVHKMIPMGMATEQDMFQAGCVGLIEAIDRFDPRRGTKLSTYAAPRIKRRIADAIRREISGFTIPRRVYDAIGRRPEDERSEFLDSIRLVSVEEQEELKMDSFRSIMRNTKEESVEDMAIFYSDFKTACNTLSEEEKHAILLKTKEIKTSEVAERVGRSKSWVNKTCNKLYEAMTV